MSTADLSAAERRAAALIYAVQRQAGMGSVGQMETGAVLEPAVKYQRIARTKGIPRHNH